MPFTACRLHCRIIINLNFATGLLVIIKKFVFPLGINSRKRKYYFLHTKISQNVKSGFVCRINRNRIYFSADFFCININKANGSVCGVVVVLKFLHKTYACVTRTDNSNFYLFKISFNCRVNMSQGNQKKTKEFSLNAYIIATLKTIPICHSHCKNHKRVKSHYRNNF